MNSPQTWFTTAEGAKYLSVNVQSFKSVMKRNGCVELKTSKNGDLRWHRSQLDAFRIYNASKPTLAQKFKLKILDWVFKSHERYN
ncbi:MAG: hypothetical protein HOB84_05910 [Candidatus Marinimicrobia bacterium]|jgi:hypothetical protein|nr:hypothetical protein [Candidatus Neomarinimicrobiota bacterium]MBT4033309.1 hypothetical protein [Candidatus Neomarinimicrobiota bacterium]MBT4360399.1 hypothetical protein [Candidatus Neomarinimicrobiota bacterium]MBT4714289.1 hypothetical protein [Candidatus Neomarinimicrobiota bacterium]MBT4944894.1 hypothetical protein [Candidatus Neomarinimicrobiota bacterium]